MNRKAKAAKLLLKLGGQLPDSFFERPKPKGYVLTDKDKQEIASKVSVPLVERVVEKVEKTEVIRERPTVTEVTQIIKELDKDEMRRLLYEFLSNNWHGGGNANRDIKVDGANVLRPFTDINLIAGTNVTISTSANQTTKYTDMTIAASGGSSGGSYASVAGTVNAVNQDFTYPSTPQAVVSDGITYFEGNGYSYSSSVISMDVPPSQYIKAFV